MVRNGMVAAPAAATMAAVFAVAVMAAGFAAGARACEFPPVKAEIDRVLDHDKDKATVFRNRVKEGWDSLKVLSELVTKDVAERIDRCRFDAAEYLAKRGFPPAH